QPNLGVIRLETETQNVFEVGQSVVASKAHVVLEKCQHQGVGHGLGNDRQIHTDDMRAEGEPGENERQQTGNQQQHQHGKSEVVETKPVPGQFLPVQKHHEVRQQRIAIHTAITDLPHQVHAHGITTECEKCAVAETQNTAV